MDTWDGSNGKPIITHGHTLCTKISFDDVCKVIKKYSFVTTPFPLILSIENHCSVDQQEIMADILLDTFGGCFFFFLIIFLFYYFLLFFFL